MHKVEYKTQRGFTLVELLVVIMIMSVMGAMAWPSLVQWMDRTRLSSYTQRALDSLWLARNHAISSGVRVTLCPAGTNALCADAGRWDAGWLVFMDANRNGLRDPDEGLLWQESALNQGWRFWGNAQVANYISYDPDGRSTLNSGAMQAGTITLCKQPAIQGPTQIASRVVINMVGRPRVESAGAVQCG